MNIENLLNEEIKSEFECLKELEAGSEEYKATVDGLTKLVDRAIEIDKMNIEHDEKEDNVRTEQKDRLIKNCLSAAGILIPALVTIWGTFKTLNFEKEGTVTTIMGRGFINKLIPKK
jgi:hypothetical protein